MNPKTQEFREKIAECFIHILEEKELNWSKGWKGGTSAQINAATGKPYRGINQFCLAIRALEIEMTGVGTKADNRWATFNQIKEKGWKLKKGSKGTKVEFWQPYDFEAKKPISWEELHIRMRKKDEAVSLISKYYVVFNGRDIEGIPVLESGGEVKNLVLEDELIKKISVGMEVEIKNDGGDRAFYRPSEDAIHLPARENFYTTYEYNATALHELSHATGHEKRLNRNLHNYFGSESYAYEELVAEISASFMSEHLDIVLPEAHMENHKAYVQSWIKAIKESPDALIHAIKDAGEAANLLEYHAGILSKEEYLSTRRDTLVLPEEKENQRVKQIPKDVKEELTKAGYKVTPALMAKIKELNQLTGKEHTLKDLHDAFKDGAYTDTKAEKAINQIGKALQEQELVRMGQVAVR